MEKISETEMKQLHKVSAITFNDDKLIMIIDGQHYEFLLTRISSKLARASKIELENYKLSPSGYGIYWSLLDEDLSIDGLLKTAKPIHKITRREKT